MKVSIIGAGHVGATAAFSLVVKGLCDDIVLANRTHRKAEGEAADLQHAAAFVTRAISIIAGDIANMDWNLAKYLGCCSRFSKF